MATLWPMITADELTDEAIRKEMDRAFMDDDHRLANLCADALDGYRGARGRVAEIISERMAKDALISVPRLSPEKLRLLQWLSDRSTMLDGSAEARIVLDEVIAAHRAATPEKL